jgi:hypothetical protein
MKFGVIKLGKSNEDKKKVKDASGDGSAVQIAELEDELNSRANDLKQTEAKLKKLSGKGKNGKDGDDVPVTPHGPIDELTIEPEVDLQGLVAPTEEEADIAPEGNAAGIKLVEVKIQPDTPLAAEKVTKVEPVPPPAPAAEDKGDLSRDSLNALFTSDDEEENPLAGLMRSLPDVAASELLDDIKEIRDIMEDWQKK